MVETKRKTATGLSDGLVKTRRRVLTRRGVVWLGQTCNQRCYFCYFLNRITSKDHPEHPFMSLEKAKAICSVLRDFYGNTSVDIQGGEPTIFPGIHDLVRHCRAIGLLPTLITNGLKLANRDELIRYRDAGLRDFLVSLHGLGEVHDQVVGLEGASTKIEAGIANLRELGIPFRYNCTMSKPVVPLLPQIAQHAIDSGARAVNYIAFNPFEDQDAGIRTHENVPRYTELLPRLTEAMDMLEAAGIEVNVRYLPLCLAEKRHRKNFYNFVQLPYDLHEWDYQSWMWTGLRSQRMRDGGLTPPFLLGPLTQRVFRSQAGRWRDAHACCATLVKMLMAPHRLACRGTQAVTGKASWFIEEARIYARQGGYTYVDPCNRCAAKEICDGVHGDYVQLFGCNEIKEIEAHLPVYDPCHYIREQDKIVEPEEQDWAL